MDKLVKIQAPIKMLLNPIHLFSFGFGSGLVPRIPGTMGTLIGVLLFIILPIMDWRLYLTIIVCAFLSGIFWLKLDFFPLEFIRHPMGILDNSEYFGVDYDTCG